MGVIYDRSHSITLISETGEEQFTIRRSWDDYRLIPKQNHSTPIFAPNYLLVDKPFTSETVDYTQLIGPGLTFESSDGEWVFIVDHDAWPSWSNTKKSLEAFINGKRLFCVFEDDPDYMYSGRFAISGWEDGTNYSEVTISYYIDGVREANRFEYVSHDNYVDTIQDSWEEIHESCRSVYASDNYLSRYTIGDTKTLMLSNGFGSIQMQIVAFDTDRVRNYSRIHAPITWIATEGLLDVSKMHDTAVTEAAIENYFGWYGSIVQNMLFDVYGNLPNNIRDMILQTYKYYYKRTGSSTPMNLSERIWIPSYEEIFGGTTRESSGISYSSVFSTAALRKRILHGRVSGLYADWWLRSVRKGTEDTSFEAVSSSGSSKGLLANSEAAVVIGICTG